MREGDRHVRHAVLRIRRDLAVPVDAGADIEVVGQIDPEPLAGIEDQALTAGSSKAKNRCRAPVDIEGSGRGGEADRCRRLREGKTGQLCSANCGSTCG